MTLTALTCTYQRPEAMALCRKYLARQTRQPDQWLILDGPEPMPVKVLAAIEQGRIEGEVVCFIEDDDWFRADWIEWCDATMEKGYDLVGEGNAVYWNCAWRWSSCCFNVRHAALVQTAVHRDMLESVANVIRSYQSVFFDTRLWCLDASKFLALPESPAQRRIVGIKGMYAKSGYSGEHYQIRPEGTQCDPSMETLHRWIGSDALDYAAFHRRNAANPETS
jgi:hypothetical protein